MKSFKLLLISMIFFQIGNNFALAQNADQKEWKYDRDKYEYCRDRAYDISGYTGESPKKHKSGQFIKGAIKGAASASGLSWITGGNSKDRKRAAKRGAALGLLIGAIKQGESKKENKKLNQDRQVFKTELDECMNS